jgi:hypothetical protein
VRNALNTRSFEIYACCKRNSALSFFSQNAYLLQELIKRQFSVELVFEQDATQLIASTIAIQNR